MIDQIRLQSFVQAIATEQSHESDRTPKWVATKGVLADWLMDMDDERGPILAGLRIEHDTRYGVIENTSHWFAPSTGPILHYPEELNFSGRYPLWEYFPAPQPAYCEMRFRALWLFRDLPEFRRRIVISLGMLRDVKFEKRMFVHDNLTDAGFRQDMTHKVAYHEEFDSLTVSQTLPVQYLCEPVLECSKRLVPVMRMESCRNCSNRYASDWYCWSCILNNPHLVATAPYPPLPSPR